MSHPSVSPEEFAEEIRAGADLVVVDLRDPAAFDAWRVHGEHVDVRNITPTEITRAPEAVARSLGTTPVRVLCARGVTAIPMAGTLRAHGADAAVVEAGMLGWARVLVYDEIPMPTPTRVLQFRREARGCLSYLVVAGDEALVVDPAPDPSAYIAAAAAAGATIRWVADTHLHADHLSGAREVIRRTDARHVMSVAAVARGVHGVHPVDDGDTIPLGDADLRVIALPGHTTDNVGLLVDGAALIAGDSLFADSVARPDLEAGDEGADAAARILHRTLHDRVLSLPPDLRLLPCHYAGGILHGPVTPTLGEVRARLPLLDLDEDAFASGVLAAMGPRPANYLEIIAANRDGAAQADAGLEMGANNCAAG